MKTLAILGTGEADTPNASVPPPILSAATYCQPALCPVPGVVFPSSPAARDICARAYLEAGIHAERSGHAGAYINTVGDYGLAELRQACSIPVTGSGEAAIRTAQAAGKSFAVVTIWPPKLRFIYDAILAATDSAADCLAIHHVSEDPDLETLNEPENFVSDMQSCSMTSMAKIRAACQKALEEEGAKVIILGCTCMQPVAGLLEADNLPVIEPMVSGYRYLEFLVKNAD